VATANDISQLPPELLRKGRFDEVFFVDLPFDDERADIFRIHIQKRGRDAGGFDLAALAGATRDFSGAEIEQVVISALFDAFSEGRELADADLMQSITETTPLSKTMEDQVDALRNWAESRCRYASADRRQSSGASGYQEAEGGFAFFSAGEGARTGAG
jgi:SpoVK/Ycf46/Vps4 family AAA+-type ATPase